MISSGYNVLLYPKEPPEDFKKMSILEFLREIEMQQQNQRKVAIYGLDTLLLSAEHPRKLIKYIREDIFKKNHKNFRENRNAFLFIPRNELDETTHLYAKFGDKKANISSLFAMRLTIKELDLYYADFDF